MGSLWSAWGWKFRNAIIDKRLEQEERIRALAEKNRQAAAKKKQLEEERKAAAEVQPRLSAHQQMEQQERVAISVLRPSKEDELFAEQKKTTK